MSVGVANICDVARSACYWAVLLQSTWSSLL